MSLERFTPPVPQRGSNKNDQLKNHGQLPDDTKPVDESSQATEVHGRREAKSLSSSSGYNPPEAEQGQERVWTSDVGANDRVVRQTTKKDEVIYHVFRCRSCPVDSSLPFMDNNQLRAYWNRHWQDHKHQETLSIAGIVKEFGFPVVDASQSWFKERRARLEGRPLPQEDREGTKGHSQGNHHERDNVGNMPAERKASPTIQEPSNAFEINSSAFPDATSAQMNMN